MRFLRAVFGLPRCRTGHAVSILGRDRKGRRAIVCMECGKVTAKSGFWMLCQMPIAPSALDRKDA